MLRAHRKAHRRIWIALAVLLPVFIAVSLWLRQPPATFAPVRISPPAAQP